MIVTANGPKMSNSANRRNKMVEVKWGSDRQRKGIEEKAMVIRKSDIVKMIVSGYFSGMLYAVCPLNDWHFWAILIPVTFGFTLAESFDLIQKDTP